MGTRIEQIGAALVIPDSHRPKAVEEGHQRRSTVDHRGIDDLALTRGSGFEERAHHAEGEVHATTAEVADEVERRNRGFTLPTHRFEGAGEGDVVDVVAGGLRIRALLAPTGHSAVDEAGVAGEAVVGADTEPLGDPGPEALDQAVGGLDEPHHRLEALGRLHVDTDRATAAQHDVGRRHIGIPASNRRGSLDADHVGAHVGQHHGAERPRADARQLDDAYSGKGSHGVLRQPANGRDPSPPVRRQAKPSINPRRCGQ